MGDERKEPLRLVDGKFMCGNVEEKPEIGNVEQIALLQRKERALEKQEEDGIEVIATPCNIDYDIDYFFTCTCGGYVSGTKHLCYSEDEADFDEFTNELDDAIVTCENCGLRYEIQDGFAKVITR